jgi:hypothetical protein
MDEQLHQAARKPGRPSKPGRKEVHAWVPDKLVELLRADADAQDVPLSDRLAEILASHYSKQGAMQKAS